MQGLASGASAAQGLNISITYGQQKSTQHSQGSGTQALASGVQAGGSTTLLAQGGPDSTISVTGSDIAGKQGTALYADKGITLQAATGARATRTATAPARSQPATWPTTAPIWATASTSAVAAA